MTSAKNLCDALESGLLRGDRAALGRAISLVESLRPDHRQIAQELLTKLLPRTGNSYRIGITGIPGVGKSTFVEAYGSFLTAAGHRVAVLAVDPTSKVSGGSILGDKTRMSRLGRDPAAFIRPSPSGDLLGGVARATREAMLLCEAAGFDTIIVETVGVGQSETTVAEMVDVFVVLTNPGVGDELQCIKRGVLELVDVVAVNKADGENRAAAEETARGYNTALRFTRPSSSVWRPPVLLVSAKEGTGLVEFQQSLDAYLRTMQDAGRLNAKRSEQQVSWLWSAIQDGLMNQLREHPTVRQRIATVEHQVRSGETTAIRAAEELLAIFQQTPK